jgi:vacuolar-type H+-ATPase subunit H
MAKNVEDAIGAITSAETDIDDSITAAKRVDDATKNRSKKSEQPERKANGLAKTLSSARDALSKTKNSTKVRTV